jgi:hypothetical protein
MKFANYSRQFSIDFQNIDKIPSGSFFMKGVGGDGILGLAPRTHGSDLEAYNFLDQLLNSGQIQKKMFSIFTSRV